MSPLHAYEESPSWGRRIGLLFLLVVALAVAGYVGSVVGPHFKSASAPTTTTTTTTKPQPTTTTSTVPPASVKVVVANGTQTAGAAGHFSQLLQQQGWNVAPPQNTSSPVTATAVYYAPGKQQGAAQVASAIGAPGSAVQPLTPTVPVANTSGDDVVVVIGPDLAQSAGTTTTTS